MPRVRTVFARTEMASRGHHQKIVNLPHLFDRLPAGIAPFDVEPYLFAVSLENLVVSFCHYCH